MKWLHDFVRGLPVEDETVRFFRTEYSREYNSLKNNGIVVTPGLAQEVMKNVQAH